MCFRWVVAVLLKFCHKINCRLQNSIPLEVRCFDWVVNQTLRGAEIRILLNLLLRLFHSYKSKNYLHPDNFLLLFLVYVSDEKDVLQLGYYMLKDFQNDIINRHPCCNYLQNEKRLLQ